jgi:hypothetical protein
MPRSGSGEYNLPTNSWNPAVNGASATSTDYQALINDVETAIQQSVSADGQTPITGDFNFGGYDLLNFEAESNLINFTPAGTGAVVTTVQTKLRETVSVKDFGAGTTKTGAENYAAFALCYTHAVANGLDIEIPGGAYTLNTTWVIDDTGVRVMPKGKVTLNFTNSWNCVEIGAGASGSIYDVHFGEVSNPIWINGNASTTNAVYWRSAHHSSAAVKAWNCITGLRTAFAVLNDFYITVSVNENSVTTLTPTYGIYADRRGAGEDTAANNYWNPVLEGILTGVGEGVHLEYTNRNKFYAGTSEGNKIGVYAASTAVADTINGMYCEANSGAAHFDISGTLITLLDCNGTTSAPTPTNWVRFRTGATDCRWIGGDAPSITVDAGAVRTQIIGGAHAGTDMVTDNGTNTLIIQGPAASKFPLGVKFGSGTLALDSYAVGTTVVTMTAGTSGTITLNASFQTLGYVKIGRLVTYTGILLVSSVSSPVGALRIAGLGFSTDSAQSSRAGVAVRAASLTAGATTQIQGYIGISSNSILLEAFAAGAADTTIADYVQANTEFVISASYIAAS